MAALPVLSDEAEAFAVFARELNFTRAAERLYISQPALHAKVRKFSGAVGLALYENRRGVLMLTSEGRELAEFIDTLQRDRDRFASTLQRERDTPIVLAAGEGAFLYVLGPAVEELLTARTPGLSLITADAPRTLAAVCDGEADIGVGVFRATPDELEAAELVHVDQVVACQPGHRFARRRSLTLKDLAGEPMVTPPLGRPTRDLLEAELQKRGAGVHVAVEARGWALVLKFVTMGAGCALVNACLAERDDIRLVRVRDLPPIVYTAVMRHSSRRDLAVAAAFDTIQRLAQPQSHRGVR